MLWRDATRPTSPMREGLGRIAAKTAMTEPPLSSPEPARPSDPPDPPAVAVAEAPRRSRLRMIPAIAAAVAVLLAATGMAFAGLTEKFFVPILWKLGAGKNQAYEIHNVIRKSLHVPAYAILGCFIWWAVGPRRGRALWAVGITVLIGCLDEWLQSRTPGRTGRPMDVLLDLCAASLGVAILSRRARKKVQGAAPRT